MSTPSPPKQLHIQAIQSIIPGKLTDPGQPRRIGVAAPLHSEALQSRLRIVFYYKKASDEDSAAMEVAAWMKESLSMALTEHPVLAGRLRRDHESDGYWEIKYNDAGVRLVQATAEITMSEFLDLDDRDGRENLLAYWQDVDRENPELSALFYIQVTEFQGDGYSIGISCSLLLADPLFVAHFLEKWSASHRIMVAHAHPKTPIFHLSYFMESKRPKRLKSTSLDSKPTNPTTLTILFKVHQTTDQQTLTSICIEEATQRLKGTPVSEISVIANGPAGDLKVEFFQKEELAHSDASDGLLSVASWDESFGLDEFVLTEEEKPVHVSYRIMSCGHEGLVVAMMIPSEDGCVSKLLISATVPKKFY